MKVRLSYFLLILGFGVFYACSDDPVSSGPTPYQLEIPGALKLNFPPPVIPADNPLTEEGVALGRKLFFDPILSADGTQACANCHLPSSGFTDNRQFSPGIDGIVGNRNSRVNIYLFGHSVILRSYSRTRYKIFIGIQFSFHKSSADRGAKRYCLF